MSDPTSTEPPPTDPAPASWQDRIDLLLGGNRPAAPAVAGGVVAVAAALVLFLLLRPSPPPPPELAMPMAAGLDGTTSTTVAPDVVVHVAGAVARPGVYRLPPLARVADAVDAAGGPTADADLHRLNLAAPVADGSQVYVPREGEPLPAASAAGGAAASAGPLDLNLAAAADLERLPGIGPAIAKAILDARDRMGGFRSVDDLLEVRGIGPAKLEALRELVTVR
jgi:competence protein ComEA